MARACHSEDQRDEAESAGRLTFRTICPPAGIRVKIISTELTKDLAHREVFPERQLA